MSWDVKVCCLLANVFVKQLGQISGIWYLTLLLQNMIFKYFDSTTRVYTGLLIFDTATWKCDVRSIWRVDRLFDKRQEVRHEKWKWNQKLE